MLEYITKKYLCKIWKSNAQLKRASFKRLIKIHVCIYKLTFIHHKRHLLIYQCLVLTEQNQLYLVILFQLIGLYQFWFSWRFSLEASILWLLSRSMPLTWLDVVHCHFWLNMYLSKRIWSSLSNTKSSFCFIIDITLK